MSYSPDLEKAIQYIAATLDGGLGNLTADAAAIRLLEMDEPAPELALGLPGFADALASEKYQAASEQLRASHGQDPVWVVSADRHTLAAQLARQVIRQGPRRVTWRDRLDDFLLHPVAGYVILVMVLFLLFQTIYGLGSAIEGPLLGVFTFLEDRLTAVLGAGSLPAELVIGIIQGVSGGVAIVLPYLVPFLLGLGFLEDMGYLPRVAFLMDALMHRLGLHGKAVVPFILGYGCNVPAVMSTRMLEERRDRFLAAALATLVPCAARLAVVFGLVAFYMGPLVALLIYLFNLFVIALTGRVISSLMPEDTPGLILEMPVYRVPTLKNVIQKAWFRAREFVVEAWPILILGSLVLAVLNYFNFAQYFNILIRPVTWGLGLPAEVGVPLIFGVLRKELSLIMLRQALGVQDFSSALNNVQMITFTVFVVFYVPCLATLAVLRRELGTREMLLIGGLTVVIASLAALAARFFAMLFY